MTTDPLDRPVWSALTGGWLPLSLGDARALRLRPDYGPFAAVADFGPDSLAAFAALPIDRAGLLSLEADAQPCPPGLTMTVDAIGVQMVLDGLVPGPIDFEVVPLGDADAPEMLALALLTKPGPFASRTHKLSDFIGVKVGGKLAAMAGERMRWAGFSEVSGICTHPEHRGQGYAAGLSRMVTQRILDHGETPFLHAYANNVSAIRLYEALGFRIRREIAVRMFGRA